MTTALTITGNDDNNTLVGTDQSEAFFGFGGDDLIQAKGGRDRLLGGSGDDTLVGGKGTDTLAGGTGSDRVIWNEGDGSDLINTGADSDVIEVNYTGKATLTERNGDTVFRRTTPNSFRLRVSEAEVFEINGSDVVDHLKVDDLTNTTVTQVKFLGNGGDDTLDGSDTKTPFIASGGSGNDNLIGGFGVDFLSGDDGNDIVAGEKGNDTMLGGAGDDVLEWDDGDGNDIISGGDGADVVEVEGSVRQGDNFKLSQIADNKALFERVGLDGRLGVGRFTLTVDTAEVFDVAGDRGNDTFEIQDSTGTGVQLVKFSGGSGYDTLDASATNTVVNASGGRGKDRLIGSQGNDTLNGGRGDDVVIGGDGVDTLTGGGGSDQFVYRGNPFAAGTPIATPANINALNKPDILTDFNISQDQFVLDATDLGINAIQFQKGASGEITGNGNVIVLTNGFANAAAAARAIANNTAITADEGAFIYFNTTLGISRLVYSEDLSDGGNISVLANLTNQSGATGLTNLNSFTASNFALT